MKSFALSIAALFIGTTAWAADMTCRVIHVQDGDSLTCLTSAEQRLKVRLADLDAPEMSQAYGPQAQRLLFQLAYNREVELEMVDQDRYGLKIARIRADGIQINEEMVRQGAAWADAKGERSQQLPKLEAEAKSARRGLWSLPAAEVVAPWQWRENRLKTLSQQTQP